MFDVGDVITTRLTLGVTPDVSTDVSVTVTGPAGWTNNVVGPSGPDNGDEWVAQFVPTVPGTYVAVWTVEGTGAGVETGTYYARPTPVPADNTPTWLPSLADVAKYVPQRTLARNPATFQEAGDSYLLTFDDTTRPTDAMVQRLIVDGAAWVTARAANLHVSLGAAAATCTAIYAAAAVERGWPHDDNSLQRANDLEKRLDTLLADLVAANNDANDEENGEGDWALEIAPLWYFPQAPVYGDWAI